MRDLTAARMAVDETGSAPGCQRVVLDNVLHHAALVGQRPFADALAARWNACADALALLDGPTPASGSYLLEVHSILRRAIYGDESR